MLIFPSICFQIPPPKELVLPGDTRWCRSATLASLAQLSLLTISLGLIFYKITPPGLPKFENLFLLLLLFYPFYFSTESTTFKRIKRKQKTLNLDITRDKNRTARDSPLTLLLFLVMSTTAKKIPYRALWFLTPSIISSTPVPTLCHMLSLSSPISRLTLLKSQWQINTDYHFPFSCL